jgi:uncharacterized protein (DUF924 family)
METPDSVLEFWFGTETDEKLIAEKQGPLWWKKKPEVDRLIKDRFAATTQLAAEGGLTEWLQHRHGRLALILLTDQFPRNMYRDTPQAFDYDHLARQWCRSGLADGSHLQLNAAQRIFFYLPLEHSEFLEDQRQSVGLYTQLVEGLPADKRADFAGYIDYAQRHHDIVRRFGRFPHRNRILGRESTEAELTFLTERGSSF